MKKKNNSDAKVFWITGLSGSGKTILAKKIHKHITKSYGPTICISGDDIRKIFNIKGYKKAERLKIGKKYVNLVNYIIKQNINVIIAVVGLFHELRKINKRKFKNYIEIYIKCRFKNLKMRKNKFFYKKKTQYVWGSDLRPEFPINPDITINNDFKKNINKLTEELIYKIDKKLK